MTTILTLALMGQLEMNVELGEGALDPLPVIFKSTESVAETKEPASERRLVLAARRAEPYAQREVLKVSRRELIQQRAQAKSAARRYRLSQPRPPSWAERYYASAFGYSAVVTDAYVPQPQPNVSQQVRSTGSRLRSNVPEVNRSRLRSNVPEVRSPCSSSP